MAVIISAYSCNLKLYQLLQQPWVTTAYHMSKAQQQQTDLTAKKHRKKQQERRRRPPKKGCHGRLVPTPNFCSCSIPRQYRRRRRLALCCRVPCGVTSCRRGAARRRRRRVVRARLRCCDARFVDDAACFGKALLRAAPAWSGELVPQSVSNLRSEGCSAPCNHAAS